MSVVGGILITTAAGAIVTSTPSFAQVPSWGGDCCSSSSHHRFGQLTRNRSWNGNENDNINHIRLRIHNRNNNIAVARAEDQGRERGNEK